MADEYIDIPIEFDETALYNEAVATIQDTFPDWLPIEGSLINLVLKSCATMAATGAEVASGVPFSIFKAFLNWVGYPPLEAISATVMLRFNAVDDAGHIVPATTPVGMSSSSVDTAVGFQTLNDAEIPNGSTFVDTLAIAVLGGQAGNNLNAVVRVDTLSFISSIELAPTNASTTGGQDAETDTEFATRGSQELVTWSETPILGSDFALISRRINGVYRCGYIENYNPADGTYNNDKMVTLCPIDENGAAVTVDIQNQVKTLLEGMREINFVCNVMDPVMNEIDIEVTVHISDSSAAAATAAQSAVQTALNSYLQPSTWGLPTTGTGEVPVWNNQPVVRYSKVMTVIESVQEVDWAELMTMGITDGSMGTSDITMDGAFALPQLTNTTINVVSP